MTRIHAHFFPIAALASATALAFAFFMQYGRGLDPCHLCILQRWPYAAAFLVSLAGWFFGRTDKGVAVAMIWLCAALFLGETGLALYHAGVEQHWWKSAFEGCAIDFKPGGDLLAQIEARPPARCDSIPWSLLGLSMAGWNALYAAALTVLSIAAGFNHRKKAF